MKTRPFYSITEYRRISWSEYLAVHLHPLVTNDSVIRHANLEINLCKYLSSCRTIEMPGCRAGPGNVFTGTHRSGIRIPQIIPECCIKPTCIL